MFVKIHFPHTYNGTIIVKLTSTWNNPTKADMKLAHQVLLNVIDKEYFLFPSFSFLITSSFTFSPQPSSIAPCHLFHFLFLTFFLSFYFNILFLFSLKLNSLFFSYSISLFFFFFLSLFFLSIFPPIRLLVCLLLGKLFCQVSTHQGPVLALVYLPYINNDHSWRKEKINIFVLTRTFKLLYA